MLTLILSVNDAMETNRIPFMDFNARVNADAVCEGPLNLFLRFSMNSLFQQCNIFDALEDHFMIDLSKI